MAEHKSAVNHITNVYSFELERYPIALKSCTKSSALQAVSYTSIVLPVQETLTCQY